MRDLAGSMSRGTIQDVGGSVEVARRTRRISVGRRQYRWPLLFLCPPFVVTLLFLVTSPLVSETLISIRSGDFCGNMTAARSDVRVRAAAFCGPVLIVVLTLDGLCSSGNQNDKARQAGVSSPV